MAATFAKLRRWAWSEWSRWRWKGHWQYLCVQLGFLLLLLWWIPYTHLPWTGVSVAIIAVLAALMSVHPEIAPRHKAVYFVLMSVLLITEFRAIRKDRDDARNAQATVNTTQDERLRQLLSGEQQNTKNLIEEERGNSEKALKQDQQEFSKTLQALMSSHREDEKQFTGILRQQGDVIKSQQDMSEQFAGRMVPAGNPTPPNGCDTGLFPKDQRTMTVILDKGNAAVSTAEENSYRILVVNDFPVVEVEKFPDRDEVYLSVDFRNDKSQILTRINKDGIRNSTASLSVLRPNKSTILIEDPYGRQFFRATYLNSRAVKVEGNIIYCGKVYGVQQLPMRNSCAGNGFNAIAINAPEAKCSDPPPMPQ